MIKAIITDIDGVIVGGKHGVNFPLPNDKVIHKLKQMHVSGFPIVFCTGKFQSSIQELVKRTQLANPHITDGGAFIIDPLKNIVIKKHTLKKEFAHNIVGQIIAHNVYVAVFGTDEYFVQKDQVCEITPQQKALLQQAPKTVDDLQRQIEIIDVIKIIAYAKNDQEKLFIDSLLQDMLEDVHMVWTMNEIMLPTRVCLITQKEVSKKTAVQEVFSYLKISPEETLGIGDTLGDWNFMNMCKYVATVGNESQELKELVKTKGEGNYFIGSSVDEDGFLAILDYFKL